METKTKDAAFEEKKAEFANAPVKVRRVSGVGSLFGFTMLLSYCASAFAGYVEWGRGLTIGFAQLVFCWWMSFSILDRKRGAWLTLGCFVGFQTWGATGSLLRTLRVVSEGNWRGNGAMA